MGLKLECAASVGRSLTNMSTDKLDTGQKQESNADDQKTNNSAPKKAVARKSVASTKKATSSIKAEGKSNKSRGSSKPKSSKAQDVNEAELVAKTVKKGRAEVSTKPAIFVAYVTHVIPNMMKEYNYRSVMQVPKLEKIALNVSVGEAKDDNKALDSAVRDLTIISGQKPVVRRARKDIAGFKLRAGMPVGVSVTLRGNRMGYFFERLLSASLPRIRDFRGLSRSSFDGRGNYSIGIREQVTFPEIDYNQIDRIRGLQVTICTTAKTDSEGARFLELLGMPFVREE